MVRKKPVKESLREIDRRALYKRFGGKPPAPLSAEELDRVLDALDGDPQISNRAPPAA